VTVLLVLFLALGYGALSTYGSRLTAPPPQSQTTMADNRTYTVNVQNSQNVVFNIADFISDVSITVRDNVSKANIDGHARELMMRLLEQVNLVIPQVPADIAQQMGNDVKALSNEIAQPVPRRKWYEVSLDGLKEAATAVGAIGQPILQVVSELSKLLLPS